ncbi:MAG: DUF992 domain-containing protein [Pseudomonadota bacterium]
MRKLVFSLLAALPLAVLPAQAQDRVEIGQLSCDVAGGTGFIFGSTKNLECEFVRSDGQSEFYSGSISKFGIDIGVTNAGVLIWGVFAPTSGFPTGGIAGSYVGVGTQATVGVGVGANALLGGSNRSVALQPR